ncbi:unnamed protein product [marine sediment metagenome]|uniref:Tagatose-bisphosphate aldolase n=1 Tax=marine sediment metagenome TaxID=412755 RepID=X1DZ24_9ZZZZ
MDSYSSGLRIIEVKLQTVRPPEEVAAAFNDVVSAKEDKERYIKEADGYREDIIPKARGKAERIIREAELGQIGKMGDSDEPGVALERVKESMAVPEEAVKFVELTEIDFLAAAVGTIHGCRTPFAKLDIPRIERIRELTGVPLVLHGASGANDEEIKKGITAGICKINIDTRIRMKFTEKMREIIKTNPEEIDPRKILGPAKEAAKEIIRDRIRVFGCNGKA